jgi:hypothetical protein
VAKRLGALARGEQLKRPDDVDVVQDPGRLTGFGVPEDPAVHHRVGLGSRKESRQHGASDVGLDVVGLPERERRRDAVDPGHVLHRGVALEPAGELASPLVRDAHDHDSLAARHL